MAGPGGAEVGRVSVRVVPNTDGFRQRLKRDLRNLDKAVKANVAVDVDTKAAKAKMAELSRQLQSTSDVVVGVDVDDGNAKARLRRLLTELKAEAAAANVDIDVDVDVPQMKAAGVAASRLGASLGGMGGNVALVAAVMAVFAPALALLSGLLTTLPGLLAGIATPIAAIALGMEGLKKAAQRLIEPFNRLKSVMSSAFERAFTPLADQLAGSGLFTVLEERLPLIANGLASMAQGLLDSVTSSKGLNRISDTIGNISDALFRARPGVTAFSDGLIGLAEGFSRKFPGLADTFNQWGESFSAWVEKVANNGQLDAALDNLGKTLGELGGLIVDMAETGFEWLSDAEFGQKMETFVANVRTLVNDLMPALKQLFIDIADSVDQLVTGMEKAGGFLQKVEDALNFGAKSDKDRKNKKPDTNNFFEPFTSEDAPWREYWARLQAVMFTAIGVIKTALTDLWATISTGAATAFTGVVSFFATFPATVANAFAVVKTTVAGAFTGVVSAVSGALSQVPSVVAGFFGQIPGIVSGAIGGVVGAVSAGFGQVVATIAAAMGQALSAVVAGVGSIVAEAGSIGSKVAGAVGDLGGVLVAAGRSLMDGLLSGIKAGLGAVLDFASGIAAKIAAVKGPLPKDRKTLVPAGEALMEGLGTGLDKGLEPVIAQVKQIAAAIFDSMFESMQGRTLTVGGIDVASMTAGVGALNSDMRSLADTSQVFRDNMTLPTADVSGAMEALKAEKARLDLASAQLRVDKDRAPDKMGRAAIQAQLDQINARKREIALQREQIDYQKQFGAQVQSTAGGYESMVSDAAKMPANFAQSTADQFMTDLGISGDGALSGLARAGIDYGSQFVFNVSGIGEALSAQSVLQNKQALAATGR